MMMSYLSLMYAPLQPTVAPQLTLQSQVKAHTTLSTTLLNPPLSSISSQSTSSLQHTLLSLRGASSARGDAHRALASELADRVLAGFRTWKERHEERINAAKDEFLSKSGVVGSWEKDVQKLNTVSNQSLVRNGANRQLRTAYTSKSRAADDSEDE
jgi:hypothetical protein